jgi:hypothetical protein
MWIEGMAPFAVVQDQRSGVGRTMITVVCMFEVFDSLTREDRRWVLVKTMNKDVAKNTLWTG